MATLERSEDDGDVSILIDDLSILQHSRFHVDQPDNLAFLETFIHSSIDVYAFVAVTASLSTLDDLITMLCADNDSRQQMVDERGVALYRSIDFSSQSFLNPEYELVALHPEHFLPTGSTLTVFDRATGTFKHYVAAKDRCLREFFAPDSPRFPLFHHNFESRHSVWHMNVFLVILNAGIKFRRYFKMIRLHPPEMPLPQDVLTLMERTIELVNLIYWQPVPRKGSAGEKIVASWNSGRVAQPAAAMSTENLSDDGKSPGDEIAPRPLSAARARRRMSDLMASMDLETRQAYAAELMSGHDCDYDPALFEDAFPVDDPHLYSDEVNVQEWMQGITP